MILSRLHICTLLEPIICYVDCGFLEKDTQSWLFVLNRKSRYNLKVWFRLCIGCMQPLQVSNASRLTEWLIDWFFFSFFVCNRFSLVWAVHVFNASSQFCIECPCGMYQSLCWLCNQCMQGLQKCNAQAQPYLKSFYIN